VVLNLTAGMGGDLIFEGSEAMGLMSPASDMAGAEERVAARRVGSGGSVDDNPIHGIAIDRIIDFAVGKLDESRITEAREDLWLLRERSAAYALRNPRA